MNMLPTDPIDLDMILFLLFPASGPYYIRNTRVAARLLQSSAIIMWAANPHASRPKTERIGSQVYVITENSAAPVVR